MAVIKSGVTADQLTIDPTAKAARVTAYDSSGAEKGTVANPVQVLGGTGRALVGEYTGTSFRTVGLASNPHNLLTLWNPATSGRNVALKRLTVQLDHTTLLATVLAMISSHPTGEPSGGTVLAATKFEAAYPAAALVLRGATASDGGGATAITATAGVRVWTQFAQRPHTLAGWFTTDDLFLIPERSFDRPIILAPGDGLLINTVMNASIGAFYILNCWWEEFTS